MVIVVRIQAEPHDSKQRNTAAWTLRWGPGFALVSHGADPMDSKQRNTAAWMLRWGSEIGLRTAKAPSATELEAAGALFRRVVGGGAQLQAA